jgi:formate-dependent nitrite reductase membrane component NrfD
MRDIFPGWNWKYKWLIALETFFNKYKKALAWVMLIYGLILGIYTGILLSAFNARPLWNTSILGPLFLASGLSAGAAATLIISKNPAERKQFAVIDLVIIGIELFLIIHMFMGYLASTQVQIEAAKMFLGGEYTMTFWIFVVILGLLIPALLEILELRKYHIPSLIPPVLVIFGSLALRFVIVYAGQVSRWLY